MTYDICFVSQTTAGRRKMISFLESACQIYVEIELTFQAPKCMLGNVIYRKLWLCFSLFCGTYTSQYGTRIKPTVIKFYNTNL